MLVILAPALSFALVAHPVTRVQPSQLVQRAPAAIASMIGQVDDSELAKKYDVVVIGGGPAGVAGTLKAATLGRRALLIDKPKAAPPGGGLDWGFGGPTGLFSKALRDCSKSLDIDSLKAQGLDDDVIWLQIQNMCVRLATNNAESRLAELERFRCSYLQGDAAVSRSDADDGARFTIDVAPVAGSEPIKVTADNVLMCTGSFATRMGSIPFDGRRIFDADSINGLGFLPESVAIVGSGIIAIEYAKIFRKLGAEVTMLVRSNAMSALTRIGLDYTIAERLLQSLADDDVKVLEYTQIKEFVETDVDSEGCSIYGGDCEALTIALESKDGEDKGTINPEIFLAATGRKPRTSMEWVGGAGVEKGERGHIEVDGSFQTSTKGIFAAGDCIAGPGLASTGVDQAQRAVGAMFEQQSYRASEHFPIGMWTIPEIGYYGLTKKAAIEKGIDAEEGIATYDACLRGRVFAPDGMLKLVFCKDTAKIVGVHIIGTDACELVHYGMDLVDKETTIFDVISTLFTAVTFHELFKEAALNANEKLEFGIQWQELLNDLSSTAPTLDLSPEDLRGRFDEIDTSGDGSLDEEELLTVFTNMGHEVTESAIAQLMHIADEDGNGTLEWDEFFALFQMLQKLAQKQEKESAAEELSPELTTV